MPRFLPSIEHADFQSAAELRLYRLLGKLDDSFTVVHSLPWLRSSFKRLRSPELIEHIRLYSHSKKNVSGEIDFVICHPQYGILCVEAKGGEYVLEGAQFIHKSEGYSINPLQQVRNNAFTILETLGEKNLAFPVGYCIYFPDTDIDTDVLPVAYKPSSAVPLDDGILILPQHEVDIGKRVKELLEFWRNALRRPQKSYDYAEQIEEFLQAVWPTQLRDNSVGRAIACDNNLWLRLDKKQAEVVYHCLGKKACVVTGFAGTGKTIIAMTIAIAQAKAGIRTLILFKNKKIAAYVQNELAAEALQTPIDVSTFHAFCQNIGRSSAKSGFGTNTKEYDQYFTYLEGQKNAVYGSVLIDEAQGLNESDHAALAEYFNNANRYIFADEYQTLAPLEKGTSYASLEAMYGAPSYNLSVVYRNPYRITEEIQKIINVRQQIINMRGERQSEFGFERIFSWDLAGTINRKISALIDAGASLQDIVLLTKFDFLIPGIEHPVATSSIAAFRGMEVPIVLIVPDTTIDDLALACAMGRCTTKAILIVNVRTVPPRAGFIHSRYIESACSKKLGELFELDKRKKPPAFIENIMDQIGGGEAEHAFGNANFRYVPTWKTWVAACLDVPSIEAILWGRFLEDYTGVKVRQLHVGENRIGSDNRIDQCEHCATYVLKTLTLPSRCLVCSATTPQQQLIDEVPKLAIRSNQLRIHGNQSLLNVLAMVSNSRVRDSSITQIGTLGRSDAIFLGSVLILHHVAISGRNECSKPNIDKWLKASLLAEEFDTTIERVISSAIGSLCSRKVMRRTREHCYKLEANFEPVFMTGFSAQT